MFSTPTLQLIQSNVTIDVKEDLSWYKSRGGAYVFRPLYYSTPIVNPHGHAFVCRGQIVEELVSRFSFQFERELESSRGDEQWQEEER